MGKNKYILYIVSAILIVLIIYISIDNLLINKNQTNKEYELIEDTISISNTNIQSINKVLSDKVYINPYKENTTFAYLILIDKDKLNVERVEFSNSKRNINKLQIPATKDFILSFGINVTIPYKWHMESNEKEPLVKLKDMTKISCKLRKEELKAEERKRPLILGDRQNFYFKSLKKGKQIVRFKYLPNKPGVAKTMIRELEVEININ